MGLLSKQHLERQKYINIKDFINLVSYAKENEDVSSIISYFVINDLETSLTSYNIDMHGRISDCGHIEHYGFDFNTRTFLDEGWSQFLFYKYITYRNSSGIKCDFYYLKDDLNSIQFIQDLELDFSLCKQVDNEVRAWSEENEQNLIYREKEADFNKPNTVQLELFKQNEFSVVEASCLLAGVRSSSVEKYINHPEFTRVYDDYIAYKLMLELAIENEELYCSSGIIESIALQKYLFNTGYIIKGFNDWLTIEPAKPLIGNKPSEELEASNNELKEAQARIVDLESQLADAQESNSKNQARIEELEQLLEQRGAGQSEMDLFNDCLTDLSNLNLRNYRQSIIAKSNNQLAKALVKLDFSNKLTKGDVVKFIYPFMQEMALFLTQGDEDKAAKLTVKPSTIQKSHMSNLTFKGGSPTNQDQQRERIELIFNRRELSTTEK